MNENEKSLLARWESLESGRGLKRAASVATVLRIVGLVLFLIVGLGLIYEIRPAIIAAAAAAMGWVVAECNALRTRQAQWPIFRRYIDWTRVRADLANR